MRNGDAFVAVFALAVLMIILFIVFLPDRKPEPQPWQYPQVVGGSATPAVEAPTVPVTAGRFVVTYVGGFAAASEDSKHYRAMYMIHDNVTGQDFLGIEGIGISGLTRVGKASVEQ